MQDSIQTGANANSDLKKIPFTKYDAGWVVLCIGMAIGSGIVFMPVQIGIKGIWVFIAATLLSYLAIYWLQNLYLRTLSESEECEDYASVITQYLGKNWGVALGIAYFLMLLHGMFSYSLAVTFDSASYIKTFGLTEGLLSDSVWYGLIILTVLVAIAAQGERLLFKVSGPMVIVKFGIIVLLGIVMVPYWNFANISAFGLPAVPAGCVPDTAVYPVLHSVRADFKPDEHCLPQTGKRQACRNLPRGTGKPGGIYYSGRCCSVLCLLVYVLDKPRPGRLRI